MRKREHRHRQKFADKSGVPFEHEWHNPRTREYVKWVKGIIKRYEEDPDALRKVRWDARIPDYHGGSVCVPEDCGLVWGSFSTASESARKQSGSRQRMLSDYGVGV